MVVDGGTVTDVASDRPEGFADVEVLVVDHDNDGVDERHLARVSPGIGHKTRASVQCVEIGKLDFEIRMSSGGP